MDGQTILLITNPFARDFLEMYARACAVSVCTYRQWEPGILNLTEVSDIEATYTVLRSVALDTPVYHRRGRTSTVTCLRHRPTSTGYTMPRTDIHSQITGWAERH